MTDEAGGGAASGMMGKLSTGEMLLGIGAAWIFLVVYVIGDRISSDYGGAVLDVLAVLCLIVLASMYFSKADGDSGWKAHYPWVAVTAAWGVVILAALDLLHSVANDFTSSGEFYEITLYIAAAVVALGAYQLKNES